MGDLMSFVVARQVLTSVISLIPTGVAATDSVMPETVSQKQSNLVFKEIGSMGTRRSHGHITASLNLSAIIAQFNDIVDLVQASEANVQSRTRLWESSTGRIEQLYTMFSESLDRTETRLRFACALVLCSGTILHAKYPPAKDREKRHTAQEVVMWSQMFANFTTASEAQWHIEQQGNFSLSIRSKRNSVFLGALSLTGVGLGLFNAYEVHQLQDAFKTQKHKLKTIFTELQTDRSLLRTMSGHVEQLKSALIKFNDAVRHSSFVAAATLITTYLGLLTDNLEKWVDSFTDLLINRKLDPLFFNLTTIQNSVVQLRIEAAKWGLTLPTEALSSIINFSVSFRVSTDPEKGGETFVLLSYPLIDQSRLRLFRLLPSPFILSSGVAVEIEEDNSLLAIDELESNFIAMTERELALCELVAGTYCCQASVLGKNIRGTCLGALFLQSEEGLQLCRFRRVNLTSEVVVQVGADSVVVKAPSHMTVSVDVKCPNRTTHKIVNSGYERQFKLPVEENCVLHTPNFSFRPSGHLATFDTYFTKEIKLGNISYQNAMLPRSPPPASPISNWTSLIIPPVNNDETPEVQGGALNILLGGFAALSIVAVTILAIITVRHYRRWRRRRGRRHSRPLRDLRLDTDDNNQKGHFMWEGGEPPPHHESECEVGQGGGEAEGGGGEGDEKVRN